MVDADKEEVLEVADDPQADGRAWPQGSDAPQVIVAKKRTRRQRQAAEVITADARCSPVLVRAAIVGRARMPRAALEISRPNGEALGHVALPNTVDGFDLQQRFWLIGEPEHGAPVALIAEGGGQILLPGGRLRLGPVEEPEWSPVACRMLGWSRPVLSADAPAGFHAVFGHEGESVDSERFARAVQRFRTAAVTLPVVFFVVCFAYLFVIPQQVHAGTSMVALLAFPVVGGALMTVWSAKCRHDLAAEAEIVEAGASKWGKEIAFTQSYWASMQRPTELWDGPIPLGVS